MRKLLLVFVIASFSSSVALSQILLNEVQTSNMNTLVDEDGEDKDWFELYNTGSNAVNLNGWGVSDRVNNPMQWHLPNITLAPSEHLLIWASGKNRSQGLLNYETAIFANDTWKYIIPSSEPSSDWRTAAFNDTSWNNGIGGVGYGDGDDGTVIDVTSSVYMRKSFTLTDLSNISELLLHVDYDDGFVAFLNGVEIARSNIGVVGTLPTYEELANGDHEATGYLSLPIEAFSLTGDALAAVVIEGTNVLSLQVYNISAASSDLSSNAWLSFGFYNPSNQFSPSPSWMTTQNIGPLHTNFSLSSGETLVLADPQGNIVDQQIIPVTAVDQSYCRQTSGAAIWCFAPIPTPNAENGNTLCSMGYEPKPVFDIQSGLYNSTQTVSLYSPSPSGEIHYTFDGSVPELSSPLYTVPLIINSTATLAARCFSTNNLLPSAPEKNTYLINESNLSVPVISITTNPANLWDENIGIYVLGLPDYGGYPFFGSNIWEDWERESYIEYFDNSGNLAFEGPMGLKIHGGWSRAQDQKSLRLMFRDEYGFSQVDYPLIPDKSFIQSYKSFNLRNGGNDYYGPRFHDALMQRSMRSTEADYMAYTPVVAFLNGEYWGMYELRETENADYIESNKNVPSNMVTVISNNYLGFNVINGSAESLYEMYYFIMNNDNQDADYFEAVGELLDMQNFADYIIAETYYENGDWNFGGNNTKFWHDDRPGGKWRFMLMDLDFGMSDNPCGDYLYAAQNQGTIYGQMFGRLLENEEFRNFFILRYTDLINTVFQTSDLTAIRDTMRSELENTMVRHCQRWGSDYNYWYYGSDGRLDWNNQRLGCVFNVLQNHFALNNTIDITLDVVPAGAGRIHLSSIEPSEDQYPWTGTYFNGIPVQITAIANPGFVFEYWGTNGTFPVEVHLDQFSLNLENSENFTAYFSGEEAEIGIEISEFMYRADPNTDSGDWIELHNPMSYPIDLSGMYLKDANYFNRFDFPLNTVLDSGEYLVIAQDLNLFFEQHPSALNVIGPLNFALSNSGDDIVVFNNQDLPELSIQYDDELPWPAESDGTGRTVEFIEGSNNQNNGSNWFAGCIGGSPGQAYDPNCGTVSVEELASFADWNIAPNPADNEVRVYCPLITTKSKLIVRDITGKTITERMFGMNTQLTLDVSSYPAGLYIVELTNENGNDNKKLVIR